MAKKPIKKISKPVKKAAASKKSNAAAKKVKAKARAKKVKPVKKPAAKKPSVKKPAPKKINKPSKPTSHVIKTEKKVGTITNRKTKTIKAKPAPVPVKKIEKIIDFTEIDALMQKLPKGSGTESSVEDKLKAIYILQQVDSNIDKIRTVRGELPMEVTDLEDEIAGLETRITNLEQEFVQVEESIVKRQQTMKDAKALIKKYESQQNKVKNNREYESIVKEIEYQTLEIQLAEKRIKEHKFEIQNKKTVLESSQQVLEERKAELEVKKAELNSIIEETKKEETILEKTSTEAAKLIEDRLYQAYRRVRDNARNGLAVVAIQRDSCGGCFNQVPPQRQLDIRQHKKVIVCEHCGRILVDAKIVDTE